MRIAPASLLSFAVAAVSLGLSLGVSLPAALARPAAGSPATPGPQTPQPATPVRVSVAVDAADVVRRFEPRRIGGTNVALWNDADHFQSPQLHAWIKDLRPWYIRIPGGSWSNAVYWNGHGVRGPDGKVDPTKVGPDGFPAVDYSAYAPSFTAGNDRKPSTGFAGNVDVKTLHDWIKSLPESEALPCVNAGTGRPIDAAEWVKWAKANQYNVRYWNIGNELGGSWEPGNFLPDGSTLTAAEYVSRYNAIATAMRAVDPTIKLGGCAFAEEMIAGSGSLVDYVSIHTYPGTTTLTPQQNLTNAATTVREEVAKRREWIRKYQPAREKEIEIAYTEWNLSGGLSGSDLFSGLWHSTMLAEFARAGVSFTTQWDTFTHVRGMTAGHALIFTDATDGKKYTRKAGYHALWLWNNYTGDRELKTADGWHDGLYTFASRTDDAVYLMLINQHDAKPITADIVLSGFDAAGVGERVTLSGREYFWNPLTHAPDWSTDLPVTTLETGPNFSVSLPPFSVTHLRVPSKARPALTDRAPKAAVITAAGEPELKIVLPDKIYEGDRVRGYVQAWEKGANRSYRAPLPDAVLSAEGAGTSFDRPAARLAEALGSFVVMPSQVGTTRITADAGGVKVSRDIKVLSSVPRPVVFWDFTVAGALGDKELFSSEFDLAGDETARANKEVPRVTLPAEGVVPSEKERRRALFMVRKLPGADKLVRTNIRGVVFDLRTRDITSEDPEASVMVVMQSPANWWMPLGRVKLSETGDVWKTHQVMTSDPKHLEAMGSAYNIWFVLTSSKPVKGTLFLDRVGLMVR